MRAMKNRPCIGNYLPLKEWLEKHDGHCLWQVPLGDAEDPNAYVEGWQINGQIAIVQVHADRRGWDIYTTITDGRISVTLADAEGRLGLGATGPTP